MYSLLVFLAACCYGVLSTIVVFAYRDGYQVSEVTGSQMLLGCIGMWGVAAAMRLPIRPIISGPYQSSTAKQGSAIAWFQLLLVGCTIGLTSILYYASLQTIPASIAVILLFQFAWIGVLLEAILDRKRPAASKLLALIPIILGTFLAGGIFQEQGFTYSWAGIGLGLGAAVSYASFIIFSGRAAVQFHPVIRSSIMSTGGLLLVFIVFPPTFLWNGALWNGLWWWGLLLGLLGIVIPTTLFTIGVPKIGGGWASILSSAELPTAVVLSSLVLQEAVGPLQWIGVIIILSGIIIPEWMKERQSIAKHSMDHR